MIQSEGAISIPFVQRSDGFKWFLSFYAAFNHANSDLENTVLLLDDPAVSLHARGQKDAYKVFERLAVKEKNNVIIFTTHSPFLVDLENLHRYRIAENKNEMDEGTRISFPFTDLAATPMQPLLAAMGCPVGSSFSPKSKFLIPEGPIDYFLLHALIGVIKDKDALHPSIGIAPARNAGDVLLLTILYQSIDLHSVGLLDGDAAGSQVMEAAKKKGVDGLVQLVGTKDLLEVDFMESLFDYPTYVNAAAEAHGLKQKDKDKLLSELPKDNNYKHHVRSYFARHKIGTFSGLETAAELANQFDPLASGAYAPNDEMTKKAKKVIEKIHQLFKVK